MKPHVRRAIAFIAGRLITGRASSGIFDYTAGTHIPITGTVTETNISIYDHDQRAHVGGSLRNIHFYGDGCAAQISIHGNNFDGYDFCGSGHFIGHAQGNVIWVYDYASSAYFSYII